MWLHFAATWFEDYLYMHREGHARMVHLTVLHTYKPVTAVQHIDSRQDVVYSLSFGQFVTSPFQQVSA